MRPARRAAPVCRWSPSFQELSGHGEERGLREPVGEGRLLERQVLAVRLMDRVAELTGVFF